MYLSLILIYIDHYYDMSYVRVSPTIEAHLFKPTARYRYIGERRFFTLTN